MNFGRFLVSTKIRMSGVQLSINGFCYLFGQGLSWYFTVNTTRLSQMNDSYFNNRNTWLVIAGWLLVF
jgi:hypothetical protein